MNLKIKILYLIAALVHLVLITNNQAEGIQIISKLILMPLLMLLVYDYSRSVIKTTFTRLLLCSLFFSFLGDLFLSNLFDKENTFIFGLAAFLVAHVIYIKIFLKSKSQYSNLFRTKLLIPVVIVVVWALSIFISLKPNVGGLIIPVAVYVSVITMMCLAALSRYSYYSDSSFRLVLIGAILFMISDMIIAFNKFSSEIEYERLLIMSSYILAQFLIVNGLIKGETDDQQAI